MEKTQRQIISNLTSFVTKLFNESGLETRINDSDDTILIEGKEKIDDPANEYIISDQYFLSTSERDEYVVIKHQLCEPRRQVLLPEDKWTPELRARAQKFMAINDIIKKKIQENILLKIQYELAPYTEPEPYIEKDHGAIEHRGRIWSF